VDPLTTTLVIAAVALVLIVIIALAARRGRDRSLEPVRLGPQWQPAPGDDDEPTGPTDDPEARARIVQERTGLDRSVIDTTLNAWDEYLVVIGLASLPKAHRFQVYDPYDPPVAERGPDGPIPDPVRVARDVDRRTPVTEVDASTVLEALFEEAGDERGRGRGA
jgi:hypothetical protein